MEDVGLFYGYSAYFTSIWYILRRFCIVNGHLVYLSVLVCYTKKNLATPVVTVAKMKMIESFMLRSG
jgi:hypothetical protein